MANCLYSTHYETLKRTYPGLRGWNPGLSQGDAMHAEQWADEVALTAAPVFQIRATAVKWISSIFALQHASTSPPSVNMDGNLRPR